MGFIIILAVQVVFIPAFLQALQNILAMWLDANGIPLNVAFAIARAIVSGIAASMGF